MKLTHILIACAISICPTLAAQNQPDQASSLPIQVFITASHKDGLPISLTTTDIAVSIDKKPAQVTNVRSVKDDPLLFALLVELSKSDGEKAKTIRELGVQLFRALAVGQNQGYLVLFNDNVAMSQTPCRRNAQSLI
jgi:hypothetical protein